MKTQVTNMRALKAAVLIFLVGFLYKKVYQPLPDDFEQPWKYRLICFGADVANYFGHYLETLGIIHRINITRFSYHIAIGAYNIRDPLDQIEVRDETIEHMSVRIYRPRCRIPENLDLDESAIAAYVAPTILFYHGGGFFVGSADTMEPVTYLMAKYTNFTVIYIEFRLIPEHKFPAALTDAYETTLYLVKNFKKYNIDLANLILMGDSAGGNLATVISQRLSENDVVKPKLQILIYPLLQMFDFTLPSYRINLPKRVLGNIDHDTFKNFLHYFTGYEVDDSVFANGHTTQQMKESALSQYVRHEYLPDELRNDHKLSDVISLNDTEGRFVPLSEILLHRDVSPLLVSDEFLTRNTPTHTYLLTTEIDILRDDGFIYAHRLKRLGLNIEHAHYKNLFHGVFGMLHGAIEFDVAHKLLLKVVEHVNSVMN